MPEFLDKFINETAPEWWDKIKDFAGESTTNELIIAGAVLVCIILAIAVGRANRRDKKYAKANIQVQDTTQNIVAEPEAQQELIQVIGAEAPVQQESAQVRTVRSEAQQEYVQAQPMGQMPQQEHTSYGLQEDVRVPYIYINAGYNNGMASGDPACEGRTSDDEYDVAADNSDTESKETSYSAKDVASIVVAVEELLRASGKTGAGEDAVNEAVSNYWSGRSGYVEGIRENEKPVAHAYEEPETPAKDILRPVVMEKIELKRDEHHPTIMSYNTSRKGDTFTEEELLKIIKD